MQIWSYMPYWSCYGWWYDKIWRFKHCSRRSQTPNTKLLERVYSQIRRHMLRHKHKGPTRWHYKEDDEDVEHDEHKHDERPRRTIAWLYFVPHWMLPHLWQCVLMHMCCYFHTTRHRINGLSFGNVWVRRSQTTKNGAHYDLEAGFLPVNT